MLISALPQVTHILSQTTGKIAVLDHWRRLDAERIRGLQERIAALEADVGSRKNVVAYGADPTGVADSTAAIQSVLNLAIGSKVIAWFPPGTYKTTAALTVYDNTTVLSNNQAEVVLDTVSNVDVFCAAQRDNVHFFGINIDGKKQIKNIGTNTGRGIHLCQATNSSVSRCHIFNTYEHGVRLGGDGANNTADSQNNIIVKNVIRDCGNITHDRGWGIWVFWRVKDTVIDGNIVIDNHAGGIMVDDTSSDATLGKECLRFVINNNIVTGSSISSAFGRGICVEGSRDFSITGNVVTGHNSGILINDGQGGVDTGAGIITGNNVTCRNYGVRVVDSRDVTVTSNYVEITSYSSVAHGAIKVEQGTTGAPLKRVYIVKNNVKSNGAGISSRMTAGYTPSGAGVSDVAVIDNDVTYTGLVAATSQHIGLQLFGITGLIVDDNRVKGFYDGIHADSDCVLPIIINNISQNNVRCGIRVSAPGTLVIENITRGNGSGSYLIDSAARVSSTKFRRNVSQDSVFVFGTSTGPTYDELVVGNSSTSSPDVTATAKVRKIEVFDSAGNSLGYVQVYAGA